MMTRLEYLLKQHDAVLGWYKQAEEKGKFLVTVNTLAVGVVNGLVFIGADKAQAARAYQTTPIWTLLALSGVALIASYLWVLRAMWSRHHFTDEGVEASERFWFFGDLARMSPDEHKRAMAGWTEEKFERTMVAQNHILSESVWLKHESLDWAIACTIVGLILLFGLGLAYAMALADTPLPNAR